MNLVIRDAKIIEPKSPFHNKILDIVIADGTITKIGTKLKNPGKFEELKLANLHVSSGWFDSSVCFGEPGFEERETIENGLDVAARSGFTAVALQPNSMPVVDNQSLVSFVKGKSAKTPTELYPIGALTKQSEGKDLAELYDMKNAGAIAFGDYNKNMANANLLKIGLQYVQDFNGLVIAYAQNSDLKGQGVANEGIVSTQLGLKGIPALAETLEIANSLMILEYTGGKLHIPTISTAKSIDLIKAAKAKGLNVTCSVAVHHLVITDEKLNGFNADFKVAPPLRTEADRKALLKGVKDDTIDMITSDHNPIDPEHKKMEFDLANNGTIGLESSFGALMTVLPLETVVQKLTAGKEIFGIHNPGIAENSNADMTLFNPETSWEFSLANILSKSKNSAFIGMKMKGNVYGIYNKGILVLNKEQNV